MARPFKFDQLPAFEEAKDASRFVCSESWRRSCGISRSTLKRWCSDFNLQPVFLYGRKYFDRRRLRAFEERVLKGEFGQARQVGKLNPKEEGILA